MTAPAVSVPSYQAEVCDPYPYPLNRDYRDHRRSQYLTEVLDRLSDREIRDIARLLGNLYPRAFERELQWIQWDRDRRAAAK